MKKLGFGLLGTIGGMILGSLIVFKVMANAITLKEQKRLKFKSYYEMLNQWFMLKNHEKSLEEYFVNNGYKTIAIYGMGEMGNRLYEDLRISEKVNIKYAIDENVGYVYDGEINIIMPNDKFEQVDAIVVTAIFDFDNIKNEIMKNYDFKIISLEDIVFEI